MKKFKCTKLNLSTRLQLVLICIKRFNLNWSKLLHYHYDLRDVIKSNQNSFGRSKFLEQNSKTGE